MTVFPVVTFCQGLPLFWHQKVRTSNCRAMGQSTTHKLYVFCGSALSSADHRYLGPYTFDFSLEFVVFTCCLFSKFLFNMDEPSVVVDCSNQLDILHHDWRPDSYRRKVKFSRTQNFDGLVVILPVCGSCGKNGSVHVRLFNTYEALSRQTDS